MKLLQLCASTDQVFNCTSFESPLCYLTHSVVTNVTYDVRRDISYHLLWTCFHHVIDTQCNPKRLSDIKLIKINHDNNDSLFLEWSSDVPASFKDQCYRSKIMITYNSELLICECTFKASKKKEENEDVNENNNHEKNVVCARMLPSFMKLSLFLCDRMANCMCFELASLWMNFNDSFSCNNDCMISHRNDKNCAPFSRLCLELAMMQKCANAKTHK